eukprot:scaffold988_cov49-Attheya_sp.AAC.2
MLVHPVSIRNSCELTKLVFVVQSRSFSKELKLVWTTGIMRAPLCHRWIFKSAMLLWKLAIMIWFCCPIHAKGAPLFQSRVGNYSLSSESKMLRGSHTLVDEQPDREIIEHANLESWNGTASVPITRRRNAAWTRCPSSRESRYPKTKLELAYLYLIETENEEDPVENVLPTIEIAIGQTLASHIIKCETKESDNQTLSFSVAVVDISTPDIVSTTGEATIQIHDFESIFLIHKSRALAHQDFNFFGFLFFLAVCFSANSPTNRCRVIEGSMSLYLDGNPDEARKTAFNFLKDILNSPNLASTVSSSFAFQTAYLRPVLTHGATATPSQPLDTSRLSSSEQIMVTAAGLFAGFSLFFVVAGLRREFKANNENDIISEDISSERAGFRTRSSPLAILGINRGWGLDHQQLTDDDGDHNTLLHIYDRDDVPFRIETGNESNVSDVTSDDTISLSSFASSLKSSTRLERIEEADEEPEHSPDQTATPMRDSTESPAKMSPNLTNPIIDNNLLVRTKSNDDPNACIAVTPSPEHQHDYESEGKCVIPDVSQNLIATMTVAHTDEHSDSAPLRNTDLSELFDLHTHFQSSKD